MRIEELLNYFPYDDAPPTDERPFAVHAEVAACPWQPAHRLVRIGLKGKQIAGYERPAANLVFLVDVSGSMAAENKLPLVQQTLDLLVQQLNENDRVAIVVYAARNELVLPSTANKDAIRRAVAGLSSGGSTNAGSGIQMAYDVAAANLIPGGTNRVILCTDGDFNVGITDQSQLVSLIEQSARSGVFLSVLGYGMGNYKDSTMEKLADHGNGNYAYIDDFNEARRVVVEQLSGTLVAIAKDVKIQVEFNPAEVNEYRLLGYENRLMHADSFRDDQKDAGEIGAGHTVTALYEIAPAFSHPSGVPPARLKYQEKPTLSERAASGELLTVAIRYKLPDGDEAVEFSVPVADTGADFRDASPQFQFAAAVAAFGQKLRGSKFAASTNWDQIAEWAQPAAAADPSGYKQEFVSLVHQAKSLSR